MSDNIFIFSGNSTPILNMVLSVDDGVKFTYFYKY